MTDFFSGDGQIEVTESQRRGPHGCDVSHAEEFNRVLLDFLAS